MHALFTYVHCSRTRILVPLECRATEQSLSCSVSILALNPDTCKPVLGARNRSLVHPPQPCLKLVILIPREESRIHPSHLFQVLILTFLLILPTLLSPVLSWLYLYLEKRVELLPNSHPYYHFILLILLNPVLSWLYLYLEKRVGFILPNFLSFSTFLTFSPFSRFPFLFYFYFFLIFLV